MLKHSLFHLQYLAVFFNLEELEFFHMSLELFLAIASDQSYRAVPYRATKRTSYCYAER